MLLALSGGHSLDQNWRLFSPHLSELNMHMTNVLTFEDGTKMAWDFPRMERLSQFGRFKDEKFRKWAVDCLPDGQVQGVLSRRSALYREKVL